MAHRRGLRDKPQASCEGGLGSDGQPASANQIRQAVHTMSFHIFQHFNLGRVDKVQEQLAWGQLTFTPRCLLEAHQHPSKDTSCRGRDMGAAGCMGESPHPNHLQNCSS